jgi:hypothetical protein
LLKVVSIETSVSFAFDRSISEEDDELRGERTDETEDLDESEEDRTEWTIPALETDAFPDDVVPLPSCGEKGGRDEFAFGDPKDLR